MDFSFKVGQKVKLKNGKKLYVREILTKFSSHFEEKFPLILSNRSRYTLNGQYSMFMSTELDIIEILDEHDDFFKKIKKMLIWPVKKTPIFEGWNRPIQR